MTVRKTIQIGNPKLKKKNTLIKNFDSPRVKKVIKDLTDTMHDQELIGIAAPQIGENYQIFLTEPRKTKARKLPFNDKLRVYINPKIVKYSKEKTVIWEGCGCVGSNEDYFFGPVTRPKIVTIEAFDENGNRFRIQADGILGRVIQHEYDHLQGVEFIEKVDDYKKLMHQKYYQKRIRNSQKQIKNTKVTILELILL